MIITPKRNYWAERERTNRLHSLKLKLCGHCDFWMKCTCPREKAGRKPSCGSHGCASFVQDQHTKKLIAELEEQQ